MSDAALEALKSGNTEYFENEMSGEGVEELQTPEPVEAPAVEVEVEADLGLPEEVPAETQPGIEELVDSELSDDPVVDLEASEALVLPDTEEIFITGSKGRQAYTIDYADRAKTKKAFEYAAGFRKMQAERDQERTGHTETKQIVSKLESAWGEGGVDGIKGVISALAKGDTAVDEFVDSIVEERSRLNNLSPEEKAAHKSTLDEQARSLAWEQKMGDLKAKEDAHTSSLEQAEEKQLYDMASQAQTNFSFAGKFGNEKTETMWNETVARNALALLEKHLPEGKKPTQANFNKAFEIAHSNLSSSLKTQVSNGVETKLKTKKNQAAKAAAKTAKKGMAPKQTTAEALEKTIDDGDLSAGFRSIFKSNKRLF
jgi:hypothetical protein